MSEASQVDDTLRILLRDLAKESARPTIRRGRRRPKKRTRILGALRALFLKN